MATCKKCDKCGKIYKENDRFSARYSAKRLHSIKIEEINCLGDITERDIDLCPQCVEKFNAFMKQDKIEERNTPEYTPLTLFLISHEQVKYITSCLINHLQGNELSENDMKLLLDIGNYNPVDTKLREEKGEVKNDYA